MNMTGIIGKYLYFKVVKAIFLDIYDIYLKVGIKLNINYFKNMCCGKELTNCSQSTFDGLSNEFT